jgi:hypothetical protein
MGNTIAERILAGITLGLSETRGGYGNQDGNDQ